ncbi:MAG: peptide chain release factor 1 [Chloroflexi bacterium]|nr:peptide chain release factor 1 [Chloroflexota bacterium]
MLNRLETIERRYSEIESLMFEPEITSSYERLQALAKERASLEGLVTLYREHQRILLQANDAGALLKDGTDDELATLAKEELSQLEARRLELEQRIRLALLPKDPKDERDVIIEIRAGTGGEEAALFATELYRMYSRYAASKGWQAEVIDLSETGLGGIKEIILEVRGQGAYSRLKHDSGVHRVQRVPVTESGGRIHTSTATVAVLPEADDVEVDIRSDDLRIDIFHAGGHGGQNVQKVATAIRITHIPTGIVAICQDERSQLRNKQKAMAVLRARLFDRELQQRQEEITANRRSQVGTGERSEKVRTYNFPQNRVSDHRINLTTYNLQQVLDGALDEFIDSLIAEEQARLLQEVGV